MTTELQVRNQRNHARRRMILRYSIIPLAIVVLLGLKLISMNLAFSLGRGSYTHSDYAGAERSFGMLSILNIVETYKAPFAKGTAELQAKRYDVATRDLQAALDAGVPRDHECQVRLNLVLAWTQMGDQQVKDKKYDDAIISYDHAKSVVDGRDCGLKLESQGSSSQAKEADQKLQQAGKEANAKQDAAKQAKNGDSDSQDQNPSDNDQTSNDGEPTKDQLQKLEQQQQANAAKAREDQHESQSLDQSEVTYDGRNW